jgi:hypothetical protein
LPPRISHAGEWFLRSGIQQADGGVARYYRTDLARHAPVSTEITGYAAAVLCRLHTLTGEAVYLEQAADAARFLSRVAWDRALAVMPFELSEPAFAYFFDCGIIVRGLLSVWRARGESEFLETAAAIGRHMLRDFRAADGFHPVIELPSKRPAARDSLRWSRSTGCYQLKAALAWHDLAEAAGEADFREPYEQVLESSLCSYAGFLPGHTEGARVMDRLHAFLYFLEGLLPRARDPRCCAALSAGIGRVAGLLGEIAPEFERCDVYAQLLRVRLFADRAGVVPLDRSAATGEASRLEEFQADDGGFWFGRRNREWLPYRNPVSTAFALQALALWHGAPTSVADLI